MKIGMGQPKSSSGPRRGRPTAEQAAKISQTILSEATELFLANGYEGTSMDAVAVAAKIPRSTLYKRYGDKRELLKDVITTRIGHWSAENARTDWMLTDSLAPRLEHFCAAMLRWSTHTEVSAIRRLSRVAWSEPSEASTRENVVGFTEMLRQITDDLAQFSDEGSTMREQPENSARLLMALLSGWLQMRIDTTPLTANDARAAAHTLVDLFLNGIR